MYRTIIILLLIVNFIFHAKAQIDNSWQDSLFRIYPGASFDYLSAKVKKYHVEEIQRFKVSLKIDHATNVKTDTGITKVRYRHTDTVLIQENKYDENGMLYENVDYYPDDCKIQRRNITHVNARETHFTSIKYFRNGNIDTSLGIYVKDPSGNTEYSLFTHDSLVYGNNEIKIGDSVNIFRFSVHGSIQTRDTFHYLIWTDKYFYLKPASSRGYNFIEPDLKIHYDRLFTSIVERINSRYLRKTWITQDSDGEITGVGAQHYYYHSDGRIDKIRQDGSDFIIFIYNKHKMLQAVEAKTSEGTVFLGYIYKYKYR